jgi:hypothetical protein
VKLQGHSRQTEGQIYSELEKVIWVIHYIGGGGGGGGDNDD